MALPKMIKDFNTFIDGEGFIGRATEVVPPKLGRKFEEFRAAGMNGPVDVDQGMEKMESTITLAEYSRTALVQFGVFNVDGVALRFKGAAISDGADGAVDAVDVVMRGRFKEIDFGTTKNGDNTAMKLAASLSYFKYSVNGETLIEIDLINKVEIVGGTDRLAEVRSALGI